jgi:hypothetical protein
MLTREFAAETSPGLGAGPTNTGADLKAGIERIELTLRKISDQSHDTLQCWRGSSACTSGCFSSFSSIEVRSENLGSFEHDELESLIHLHDRALNALGEEAMVPMAIAKGLEFEPTAS